MAKFTRTEKPPSTYDATEIQYDIEYHKYTRQKRDRITVDYYEIAEKVLELVNDKTVQYVLVMRHREKRTNRIGKSDRTGKK